MTKISQGHLLKYFFFYFDLIINLFPRIILTKGQCADPPTTDHNSLQFYFSVNSIWWVFTKLKSTCLVWCLCPQTLHHLKAGIPPHLGSFTVPFHCPNGRHLRAIGTVQMDCHWGLKNGGNSHRSHEPIMHWGTRKFQSVFRPTNHKRLMPIGDHVSFPTDSPITTRLGLCSSLSPTQTLKN